MAKRKKARPMYLTERDEQILKSIHDFDGMLGAEQIRELFFSGSYRARLRLSTLYQNGYINRPDHKTRAALPQMIYWLGDKGAEYVAGLHKLPLKEFKWRKQPRFSLVKHDLAVNDFRISVIKACLKTGYLELTEWLPSGVFWANPDPVEYAGSDGKMKKRGIRPDGYFVIFNHHTGKNSRMLLELDKGSEDLARIANEKILPSIAYLRSDAYKLRTGGFASGRWLIVATGERRLENLKRTAERVAGENAPKFWFTTLEWAMASENVLIDPIWHRGGYEQLHTLIRLGDEMV